jgi:hypothetical protein
MTQGGKNVFNSYSLRSYNVFVHLKYKKYYLVHHEFANGKNTSMALNHSGDMQQ